MSHSGPPLQLLALRTYGGHQGQIQAHLWDQSKKRNEVTSTKRRMEGEGCYGALKSSVIEVRQGSWHHKLLFYVWLCYDIGMEVSLPPTNKFASVLMSAVSNVNFPE